MAAANPSDGTGGSADEPMVGGIAFGHVYEVAAESILTWDEFWKVTESGGVSFREPAPNEVD